MTAKNPLRQLASKIKDACQADGAKQVKFTTILKVLTESGGFRSIQCSDAASEHKADGTLSKEEHTFFQRFFFSCVYEHSDLFGLEFSDIAHRRLQYDEVYDPLFYSLWNTLVDSPATFRSYAESLWMTLSSALVSEQDEHDLNAVLAQIERFTIPGEFKRFYTSEVATQIGEGVSPRKLYRNAQARLLVDLTACMNDISSYPYFQSRLG